MGSNRRALRPRDPHRRLDRPPLPQRRLRHRLVATLSTDRLDAYTVSLPGVLALAVAYSIGLWLLAAGVVMGVWLTLVGIPADIPNLGTLSLLGTLVWGVTVGTVVYLSSITSRR